MERLLQQSQRKHVLKLTWSTTVKTNEMREEAKKTSGLDSPFLFSVVTINESDNKNNRLFVILFFDDPYTTASNSLMICVVTGRTGQPVIRRDRDVTSIGYSRKISFKKPQRGRGNDQRDKEKSSRLRKQAPAGDTYLHSISRSIRPFIRQEESPK